ncbi:MAG: hypothetical protein EOO10_14105 [Chitinophagaceae bacterium]|nr:MAG: hypothetical protein EOO10_14105 [Chitinophagaceae bacterium]
MKSLLILLAFSAFTYSPGILLIDIEMKNDIKTAEKFTIEDCFKKSFPVYVDDIKAVAEAAEEMAKTIDRNDQCEYSIKANHTTIYLKKDCKKTQGFSVRFVTKLENEKTYFDFELVRNEKDRRLAQQRLLDFASYLSN